MFMLCVIRMGRYVVLFRFEEMERLSSGALRKARVHT